MKPLIVLGDKTSHGGTVIGCAPFATVEGRGIARVGDLVSCPRCKGVFPIAEGDATTQVFGAAPAYEGCKTACGATLLAGQQLAGVSLAGEAAARPGAGESSARSAPAAPGDSALYGSIGDGLGVGVEQGAQEPLRYKGRFRVIDLMSGQPLSGKKVRLRTPEGDEIEAVTDEEGCTQWLESDRPATIGLTLVPDEPASA